MYDTGLEVFHNSYYVKDTLVFVSGKHGIFYICFS